MLGGGPVGVEMAPIVRWLGGEAVMVERSGQVLAREAAPLDTIQPFATFSEIHLAAVKALRREAPAVPEVA